jgi:hypothetical protein
MKVRNRNAMEGGIVFASIAISLVDPVVAAGYIPELLEAGIAEAGGEALAAETSDVVYHYTTLDKLASIRSSGLWTQSSATDVGTLTAREAVETLGVKTEPDVVIAFRNNGQFVPNRPPVVQPHPLGPGGGLDLTNPFRVGADSIVGVRTLP